MVFPECSIGGIIISFSCLPWFFNSYYRSCGNFFRRFKISLSNTIRYTEYHTERIGYNTILQILCKNESINSVGTNYKYVALKFVSMKEN